MTLRPPLRSLEHWHVGMEHHSHPGPEPTISVKVMNYLYIEIGLQINSHWLVSSRVQLQFYTPINIKWLRYSAAMPWCGMQSKWRSFGVVFRIYVVVEGYKGEGDGDRPTWGSVYRPSGDVGVCVSYQFVEPARSRSNEDRRTFIAIQM